MFFVPHAASGSLTVVIFSHTLNCHYNRQVDLGMAMAHSRQQAIDIDHFLSNIQLLCTPEDMGMVMAHFRQQAIDIDHFLSYIQLLYTHEDLYGCGPLQTTGH